MFLICLGFVWFFLFPFAIPSKFFCSLKGGTHWWAADVSNILKQPAVVLVCLGWVFTFQRARGFTSSLTMQPFKTGDADHDVGMSGWGQVKVGRLETEAYQLWVNTATLFVFPSVGFWGGVFLYMNNNDKAYFALALVLLCRRNLSRICAPVKMQINLFVRSMPFVSCLLGMGGHGRVLAVDPEQASLGFWRHLQNKGKQRLQSSSERASVAAKYRAGVSSCWEWLHCTVQCPVHV